MVVLLSTQHHFMIFTLVSFQLYVGGQERISSFKSSLALLLASPNKALYDLLREAKKAYECNFCFVLMYPLVILGERYFRYPFLVMKLLFSGIIWVTDLHSLFHSPFSALPAGSKIEDLLTLASQDVELVTDESMEDKGTSLLHEHQKLMLQHFGNT